MPAARSFRARVGAVWYAASPADVVAADGRVALVVFRRDDPPSLLAAPPAHPAPGEPAMTFDTLSALAKSISPAAGTELVPLIAAGLRLKFPTAKPTLESDLQVEFANLQATYSAAAAAEASTKALLADLK